MYPSKKVKYLLPTRNSFNVRVLRKMSVLNRCLLMHEKKKFCDPNQSESFGAPAAMSVPISK